MTTSKCLQDPVGLLLFDDGKLGEEANKSQDNTSYGEKAQACMMKALIDSKIDQTYAVYHLQIGLL